MTAAADADLQSTPNGPFLNRKGPFIDFAQKHPGELKTNMSEEQKILGDFGFWAVSCENKLCYP